MCGHGNYHHVVHSSASTWKCIYSNLPGADFFPSKEGGDVTSAESLPEMDKDSLTCTLLDHFTLQLSSILNTNVVVIVC